MIKSPLLLTTCYTGEQKTELQRERNEMQREEMEREDKRGMEHMNLLRQSIELRMEEAKTRNMQLELELIRARERTSNQ